MGRSWDGELDVRAPSISARWSTDVDGELALGHFGGVAGRATVVHEPEDPMNPFPPIPVRRTSSSVAIPKSPG
jgi:hypothetical protein